MRHWHVSYGKDGFNLVLTENPFWSTVRLEFWGWMCEVTKHRFCSFFGNRLSDAELKREQTMYITEITRSEADRLSSPGAWDWLDERENDE